MLPSARGGYVFWLISNKPPDFCAEHNSRDVIRRISARSLEARSVSHIQPQLLQANAVCTEYFPISEKRATWRAFFWKQSSSANTRVHKCLSGLAEVLRRCKSLVAEFRLFAAPERALYFCRCDGWHGPGRGFGFCT
uniref:Uncharacterized protein n=1 Tax=Rhipicephalus zambeziensis TaxID=60191 RepID=A0A224Y5T1_9ACAR